MASFCAKCGAEIPTNQQSCGTCGAPAVAAAAPAAYTPVQPVPFQPVASQPSSYQPVAAQPVAYPPPAAPAKSGSSAIKIILIVIAVFVGIGILGAAIVGYGVWRVAHSFHVSGSGDNAHVTFNAPGGGGTISANTAETFTAEDLGTEMCIRDRGWAHVPLLRLMENSVTGSLGIEQLGSEYGRLPNILNGHI